MTEMQLPHIVGNWFQRLLGQDRQVQQLLELTDEAARYRTEGVALFNELEVRKAEIESYRKEYLASQEEISSLKLQRKDLEDAVSRLCKTLVSNKRINKNQFDLLQDRNREITRLRAELAVLRVGRPRGHNGRFLSSRETSDAVSNAPGDRRDVAEASVNSRTLRDNRAEPAGEGAPAGQDSVPGSGSASAGS